MVQGGLVRVDLMGRQRGLRSRPSILRSAAALLIATFAFLSAQDVAGAGPARKEKPAASAPLRRAGARTALYMVWPSQARRSDFERGSALAPEAPPGLTHGNQEPTPDAIRVPAWAATIEVEAGIASTLERAAIETLVAPSR
jgi:hypothetical protein